VEFPSGKGAFLLHGDRFWCPTRRISERK